MTARLRGSAQYERAAVGLAVYIISSMVQTDHEGSIKHESEQRSKGDGSDHSPRFYPSSFDDK